MRDFLLHIVRNMTVWDVILLMIGSCFIGIFSTLICILQKSKVKYTYYDSEPYRQSLVVGYRGSAPVFKRVYAEKFVYWLYGRLKGQWAKREAIKKVTGGEE